MVAFHSNPRCQKLVVDSVRIHTACRAFMAAVCCDEALDERPKVNILLSLSECRKCHFQLLNVIETAGVTSSISDTNDVFIPAANILYLLIFLNIKPTYTCHEPNTIDEPK